MNILKKTFAAVVILTALVGTAAFANPGDAKVRAAADATLTKTEEALNLLEKGGDNAEVLKILSEVRQSQKEFRYEQTERLRQKAGDRLKVAREGLEKGDTAVAKDYLKQTLDFYKEMLVVYNAAHK